MKFFNKALSLLLAVVILTSVIIYSTFSVYAEETNVTSFGELVSALSSEMNDQIINITDDIQAEDDIIITNKQNLTLALNGKTINLGTHKLIVKDVSGIIKIVGRNNTSLGGNIKATETAVAFYGSDGVLEINNNVSVVSENGNAVENRSSNRSLSLIGAKISAPNGYGVLLTSNKNLVMSGNKITSADKKASSVFMTIDEFGIPTTIQARYCVGAEVDPQASAYNKNKSGVKATARISYGAELFGEEAIFELNNHFYVDYYSSDRESAVFLGSYSENISEKYSIPIRNYYTLLRDGKMFAVFKKSDIGSVDSEESLAQALQSGGAYYITDDFTVSGNTSITADADTVLEGQDHKVTFNGSGTYLSCESGIDYQLTISDLNLDGSNSVDSFFGKTESDLNIRDGNIYFYDCDSDNFINGALSFNYKLGADCILGNTFEVNEGEKIEVDLNGFTVTAPSPAFSVSGSLTIKDTQSGGKVDSQNPIEKSVNGSVKVYGGVFDVPIYDYTAADKSVFNIRNNDGTDGVYTDASVLRSAVTKGANDVFPYDSLSNLETLGIEEKITGNLKTNDITAQGIRVVTVVNEGLLKSSNIADYGYLVARLDSDRTIGELDFNRLRVGVWNGEKRISCVNSSNGLSGDYGTYEADTRYKYVTLAVNGMESGDKIVARFYIKTSNGKYYYANYKTYGGILAEYKG